MQVGNIRHSRSHHCSKVPRNNWWNWAWHSDLPYSTALCYGYLLLSELVLVQEFLGPTKRLQ